MSIIIPNMDMPESCVDCEFCVIDNDIDCAWCVASKDNIQWDDSSYIPRLNRNQDCPLIEYRGEE